MDGQIQIISRVFNIIEYLSQERGPKGPTEIAEAVGLHKSTVHRLLSTLCKRGYIEKNEAEGSYRIGIKLVEIVSNHINSLELQTEARPFLNDLHVELNLIVHLGILDRHEVVYIEKMDIRPNLRLYAQIGLRVPSYCSSLGKCLLAGMSGDQLDFFLSTCRFEQYTENTITDASVMKKHLREVRARGWAMDNEEYIIGNRCVAAPIYDYRGDIIAAVSASGPTALLTDSRMTEAVERVKKAANDISRRLCYVA